ncbi:hypothetical protein ACQKKE_02965 [Desemzia incerta]|uniref:hypothetical protein n=1 Tax=Desemzia incerta TaxID=82801 RepID=UPI003D01416B
MTLGLIVYELFSEVLGLTLEANWKYGVLSYSNVEPASEVPLMVLFVSLILIFASIIVWRKQGWIWFFVGTLIMFLGNAFPISLPSAAITNAFELILIVSLFFTKRFQDTRSFKQST